MGYMKLKQIININKKRGGWRRRVGKRRKHKVRQLSGLEYLHESIQVAHSRKSHACGMCACIPLESVGATEDVEPCMES